MTLPSRRPGHATYRWRALLPLALLTAGAQAQAQEQTARLDKDADRSPENHPPGIGWIQPLTRGVVLPKDTLASGKELWITNPNEAGAILVADIKPGPKSTSHQGLKVIGDKLYYSAHPRVTGRQFYSIDLQ